MHLAVPSQNRQKLPLFTLLLLLFLPDFDYLGKMLVQEDMITNKMESISKYKMEHKLKSKMGLKTGHKMGQRMGVKKE